MLIPLNFIIGAYKGIGFKVVEEGENPHIIVLRRDDAMVFFNALDGSTESRAGVNPGVSRGILRPRRRFENRLIHAAERT